MQRFSVVLGAVLALGLAVGRADALTFNVFTNADVGIGSLRYAITQANGFSGPDKIAFALGANKTITPASPLPAITETLEIDGTSQPGWSGAPIVELNGQNLAGGEGLLVDAPGTVIRGLVVNRFPSTGIYLHPGATGTVVKGCWVGVDPTGTLDRGNGGGGITIGGADGVVIGGPAASDRNVVSGNTWTGIFVAADSVNATITNNYVGTNFAGDYPIGNGLYGIDVYADGAHVGLPGAGNVISGNQRGLELVGDDIVVRSNRIGVNAAGTGWVSNAEDGIDVYGDNARIGEPGAGNQISSNGGQGVMIWGSSGTQLRANLIGTAADGVSELHNVYAGIRVYVADDTRIGGGGPGDGNVIAHNWFNIQIENAVGTAVLGNSIFGAANFGLDLNPFGANPNDVLDVDGGSNRGQNFPVIVSADDQGGTLAVSGIVDSVPATVFRIEVFGNPACSATGVGEGRTFLGVLYAATDASGHANFSGVLPLAAPAPVVTATATNVATADTSEFSPCVDSTGPQPGRLQLSQTAYFGSEPDESIPVTIVRTGGSSGTVSVSYATSSAGATPGVDYDDQSGTLTFGPGEVMKTFSIPVWEDGLQEAAEDVTVTLSAPTGGATLGAPSTSPVHIFSQENVFPLAYIHDAGTIVEDDAGNQVAIFRVHVSQWSQTVQVGVETMAGTAESGSDYTHVSQTLFFPPGGTDQTVTVPIIADDDPEDTETFYVRIHTVTPGGVGRAVAEAIVVDDDGAPPPPTSLPLCQNGVGMQKEKVGLGSLGGVLGNETMSVRGTLDFPAGSGPLGLEQKGLQVRIEDLGGVETLLDMAGATAIPPGSVGSSPCDPRDGWKVNSSQTSYSYVNKSGMLPPLCVPGSAGNLRRLSLRDRRSQGRGVSLTLSQKATPHPTPTGPARVTVVLGADALYGLAGQCAVSDDLACFASSSGTSMSCR